MKSEKIKVVHLVSDFSVGGVQKVVLDICSSADLEKYDIKIYALNDRSDLLTTYNLDSLIEIKTFHYEYDDDYSVLGYLKHTFIKSIIAKNAKQIIAEAIKDKPDILHVHFPPRELNLGIIIQEKTGCQLIYTEHSVNLGKNSIGNRIQGVIFRKTFGKYNLIAVSEAVKNEIFKHNLLGRNKKFFLIENKLNLSLYNSKPKKPKDHVLVAYVARIAHPKAHEDLIYAWSKLQDDPTPKKLLLIGPDTMNNEMHLLAKELIKDDSIVFMGAQYQIADILNECDFAVFPSHREGLPISLLEKMAMKLPVVVSDIAELTHVVKDNVNGLTFKCGDVDDLAKKISVLLHDTALRKRLGEKARETVEEKYGSLNIALPNELVYKEILNF